MIQKRLKKERRAVNPKPVNGKEESAIKMELKQKK